MKILTERGKVKFKNLLMVEEIEIMMKSKPIYLIEFQGKLNSRSMRNSKNVEVRQEAEYRDLKAHLWSY